MGHWWSIKSYKWTHHIKAIIPLTLLSLILLAFEQVMSLTLPRLRLIPAKVAKLYAVADLHDDGWVMELFSRRRWKLYWPKW